MISFNLEVVYQFRDVIRKGNLAGNKVTRYLCFKHAVELANQYDIVTLIAEGDGFYFCAKCQGDLDND